MDIEFSMKISFPNKNCVIASDSESVNPIHRDQRDVENIARFTSK